MLTTWVLWISLSYVPLHSLNYAPIYECLDLFVDFVLIWHVHKSVNMLFNVMFGISFHVYWSGCCGAVGRDNALFIIRKGMSKWTTLIGWRSFQSCILVSFLFLLLLLMFILAVSDEILLLLMLSSKEAHCFVENCLWVNVLHALFVCCENYQKEKLCLKFIIHWFPKKCTSHLG